MNYKSYQPLALRTAPEFKALEFERTRGAVMNFLIHGSLGLSSELAEIIEDKDNQENIVQECGDVLWYLNMGCSALGMDLGALEYEGSTIEDTYDELTVNIGEVANQAKRSVFYGKDDHPTLIRAMAGILHCIEELCPVPLSTAMSLNIEKLRKRYPEKFSGEQAVDRDVTKEEEVFKGSVG